jgi:hypothetical protein
MSNVITSSGPRIMIGDRTLATCHGADSLLATRRAKRWAKMLSVAPDLLAACKKALPELQALYESVLDDPFQAGELANVICAVQYAIQKAEGEPCPPN